MLKYIIFDTETNGLNIRINKPFMLQYLFADENLQEIEKGIFYFDPRNEQDKLNKQKFIHALQTVPTLIGANIKFDVHMLVNMGFDIELFRYKNYIDIEVLARLVIDNDAQTDSKFSVALKSLASKYLCKDSSSEEHQLKMELSRLVTVHKQNMMQYFINAGLWPDNLSMTNSTKLINEIYGDNWFKYFDKHAKYKQAREQYLLTYPAPTYQDVSNINTYALTDVILTHCLTKLWYPQIVSKGQTETLKRVSKATFPLILMEREGLVIDIPKILEDRKFLLDYKNSSKIIDPRTGKEISIGQHKVLKDIYEYETGMKLSGADKEVRDSIEDISPTAKKVNNLSKLEKIVGTYATRLLRDATLIDGEYRVFTQYKMAGTVTGRLSSDFQQFPKEPSIINGRTINVRDWFIVPKKSKYMFYFD